jgi:hypothetical protein
MILYVSLIFLIFTIEIVLSFLLNTTSIAILCRKAGLTVKVSLLSGVLYWVRLYLIAKLSDWDIGLMISSVIGDSVGDYLVAKRKIKPKRKPARKKFPVSTA